MPVFNIASGFGSGLSFTKLWENSDTTQSFLESTLSLPACAGYSGFYVLFKAATGTEAYAGETVIEKNLSHTARVNRAGVSSKLTSHRLFTVSDTGVSFGPGYCQGAQDNAAVIPYRVYGIGGVTVT